MEEKKGSTKTRFGYWQQRVHPWRTKFESCIERRRRRKKLEHKEDKEKQKFQHLAKCPYTSTHKWAYRVKRHTEKEQKKDTKNTIRIAFTTFLNAIVSCLKQNIIFLSFTYILSGTSTAGDGWRRQRWRRRRQQQQRQKKLLHNFSTNHFIFVDVNANEVKQRQWDYKQRLNTSRNSRHIKKKQQMPENRSERKKKEE